MPKESLWQAIHQQLTQDISQGVFRVGDRLPSEALLAKRFGVNRHTIRRALDALQTDRWVYTRQGAGTYVAGRPQVYQLGKRTRLRQGLGRMSAQVSLEILASETRPAHAIECEKLQLRTDTPVHWISGIRRQDGLAISLFEVAYPAARFPDLPAIMARSSSVSDALLQAGLQDYTRAETIIAAESADPARAGLLACALGSALLRTRAVDIDPDGVPIAYGLAWFVGERLELEVKA